MAGAPPAAAAAFLAVFSRADLQHRGETHQPGQKKYKGRHSNLLFLPSTSVLTYCPWHAALGLDHGVVAHLLLDRGRKGHIIELHEAGEGSGLQSHHLCHVVPPVKHARERSAMVWNARAASEAAGRGG